MTRRRKSQRNRKRDQQTLGSSSLFTDTKATTTICEDETLDETFEATINKAVVKVFCDHMEPDFSFPWKYKKKYSSTSSGFVIQGKMIVADASSVKYFAQLNVKKGGLDKMYPATVLAIGDTSCEIALLTVSDEEFWEGISLVALGDLPAIMNHIMVVGYPTEGGDDINITCYPLLRIKMMSYSFMSPPKLLTVQVDGAIISGTFGGPAFNEGGECVGIAIKCLQKVDPDNDNVGYIISTPVIAHFVNDYLKNGSYTGFPDLGIQWKKMESERPRLLAGMEPKQTGVGIITVDPKVLKSNVLQPSDVILNIDGVDIGDDGRIPFREGLQIKFSYLLSLKYVGDDARIKVLRNSVIHEFNVKLGTRRRLIPESTNYLPPSYYIVAGLVFTVVTTPYLHSEYGEEDFISDAPDYLILKYWAAARNDEQLIVLSQVLTADASQGFEVNYRVRIAGVDRGYNDIVTNTPILAFNGQRVKNLKSLAQMVESCDQKLMKFILEEDQVVVLPTKAGKAATQGILATNSILSAMSADIKT